MRSNIEGRQFWVDWQDYFLDCKIVVRVGERRAIGASGEPFREKTRTSMQSHFALAHRHEVVSRRRANLVPLNPPVNEGERSTSLLFEDVRFVLCDSAL